MKKFQDRNDAGRRLAAALVRYRDTKDRVVLALPTASADAAATLSREADDLVCIETPEPYFAVGYWYRDFSQVADEKVRRLLERSRSGTDAGARPVSP